MNIKNRIKMIQEELDNISDDAYLLNEEMPGNVMALFHEKITIPLKSIASCAENTEAEMIWGKPS